MKNLFIAIKQVIIFLFQIITMPGKIIGNMLNINETIINIAILLIIIITIIGISVSRKKNY